LRRGATLRLLDRFRTHELTDALVVRDRLLLSGLEYPGAEDDLRPVLKERGDRCEDVLEFAIELVDSWRLTSLHEDLADLVLDPSAPLHPRVSAGYVLQRSGSREARRRLRPLIAGSPEDQDLELKGLALRCCWPDELSGEELFYALTPWRGPGLHGAYFGFRVQLDREGFDAAGCRLAGLEWARRALSPSHDMSPTDLIVQRIARGALGEVRDASVAAALSDLLCEAGRTHSTSPLGPMRSNEGMLEASAWTSLLPGDREASRILIHHLATKSDDEHALRMVAHATPGLI
jgi:hypothetical protein